LGVLISGQRLKTAISCGSSLAQIGEFAFIIAALGMSLKLSSDFIYPVVVSVSAITTFTTPFFIKHAENIYQFIKKLMPARLYEKIESRTADNQSERERDNNWKEFLGKYFLNTMITVTISTVNTITIG
jgi:CPA2 family monovalent cation:H+ antiporter-2